MSKDNSAAAQRDRMLSVLRVRSISTIEARRDLDVMMPAARIHELRHREGHEIATVWVNEPTQHGAIHRVARYVLRGGRDA